MIEGFRIDVTAEELLCHLDGRIQIHREAAVRCDSKRIRLEAAASSDKPSEDAEDEDEHLALCWPGYVGDLERRAERHKSHEAALVFLRDHLIALEIYRLTESDLRLLELWPRRIGVTAEG